MAEAYVTLVATDAYAAGALVVAHRLRQLGSIKDIVCLTTPNISSSVREQLRKVLLVIEVDELRSTQVDNLQLLGRPELDVTFTKIQLWKLTQYQKVVFLDADTLPLLNVDELFDRPALSAAPDAGWPDCFNSGVFVAEPSDAIYHSLIDLSNEKGSFDGGDQGLLNSFFNRWSTLPENRLPFTYNTTPTAQYGYAPAQNEFGHNISILHFIGPNKPWTYQRFSDGSIHSRQDTMHGVKDMLQLWWDTWDKHYGRISPYHLFSDNGHPPTFDSGFQTRPIVPFDETVENAWENQQYHPEDHRRQVNPMPPLFSITISQPEWVQQAPNTKVTDFNSNNSNDDDDCDGSSSSSSSSNDTEPDGDCNHDDDDEKEDYHSIHQHGSMDQHDEGYYEDHRHSMNQQESSKDQPSYCMIEWDPAHQDPPKTGALTAEIPDLSNFKNAWDQPAVQNNIWVAPLHHPDPKVMARHEYAEYDTKEYEMAQTQFHQDITQQHTTHHSDQTKMEHPYEDQNEKISQYEHIDSSNHEYYPDHHQENLNHHQQGLAEMEPVIQTIGHPSIFPWEPSQHEPTRIWLDEQPSLESTIPVPSISNNNDNNEVPVDHEHVAFPPVFPWENVEHHFPPPTRIWQDEQQPLDAQVKETNTTPTFVSPNESQTNDTHENSSRDDMSELSDLLLCRSQETIELIHEPSSEFAIDYSPSFQNKLIDFIEMLNTTQDDDVSVRDLIPINLKSSSRLNSDLYSPSSGATSRTQSRANSRASSRRASVASSRRSSVSQRALPPPSLGIIQNIKPSSAKLFAAESSFYSHRTPYTSAAVTPAIERTPEIERDSYFDHDEWVQQQLPFKRDFLNTVDYSLERSIERQKNLSKTSDWDPLKALDKLKQQSESMVLRKSLEQVLKSSMEQQDGHELETEPLVVQNRVPLFESVWEKTAFDLSSGRSSPRTPVVLQSSSNMSKLLQLEIDKYKQQHESLMLSQPQATVASTLEAELDLSQGNLIHNSVFNQQEQQEQDCSVPIGQQSEPFATFYDWHVMEQSREKLNQLLSGASSSLDMPLYAKDPKPFVFPTNSYQHNFGFEESPKFTAPSFDMHENDALLDPIIEFAKTKLATLTNPTLEYSKDTKEKEPQASSSNITNLCEDATTAESPSLFPPTLSAALTDLTETQDQTSATFNFVQLVESTPDTQSALSDTELYQQHLLINQDFLYTENENKLSDQFNQSLNESASRSLDKGPAIFPQEESKNGHVQLAEMGDLSNSRVEHQSPFSHVESDLMSNENNSLEKAQVHELSTEIRKFIFKPTTTSTIPVDKHDDLEQGPGSLSNDIRVESSCSNHLDNQVGLSTAPNDSKRDNNKMP